MSPLSRRLPRAAWLVVLWLPAAACKPNPLKLEAGSVDSTPAETSGADTAPTPADSTPDSSPGGTTEAVDPAGDDDGDGLTNAEEGAAAGTDSDFDGTPDYLDEDSDNDGIVDADEAGPRADSEPPVDTDGDGIPDFRDGDSDGDSVLDRDEGTADDGTTLPDTDGDGTPDFRDVDADGDGMLDAHERAADWDGDGVPNFRDPVNDVAGLAITLRTLGTDFNQPVGIDYHAPTNTVALSVNYPTGNPVSLELVAADGAHATFSAMSGLANEVKIATVRAGNPAGFAAGDLFVGNGIDGQIARVSADGTTIDNPWVDLPGDSNGLIRGSLYVDRTGVWDGDLVACTTAGQVWRIDASGHPTLLAETGVHLEGLITVPSSTTRFGPIAGHAIAGAEGVGLLYAIAPDGTVTSYDVGVAVEDIDWITPDENFFGVNYGSSRLLGADGEQLRPIAGDVLLTQEYPGSVGLYRLYWDGTTLQATELTLTADSTTVSQWEHVTFADATIKAAE